jgi:hypothetical protein
MSNSKKRSMVDDAPATVQGLTDAPTPLEIAADLLWKDYDAAGRMARDVISIGRDEETQTIRVHLHPRHREAKIPEDATGVGGFRVVVMVNGLPRKQAS